MKWFNKLKIVLRMYTNRVYVTLLLFGMCFVSFFLIDRVITQFIGSQYEIWQVEKSFAVDTADAGYIYFNGKDSKQDISNSMYEYVSKLPDVENSGYIGNTNLYKEDDDYLGAYILEKDIVNLGTLKLSETQLKEIDKLSEDEAFIMIGWNQRNKYSEGDVVNYIFSFDDKNSRASINGILKKGARFIHEEKQFGTAYGEYDNFTLDNSAVVIVGSLQKWLNSIASSTANEIYIKCRPGTFDDVSNSIKKYAYEQNINVTVYNYADIINEEKEKSNILDDSVFIAAIMITLLAMVSISSANVVYCLMCRKQYGIMMANGVSKSNIMWIIVVQNMIIMIIASVAEWLVRQRALFDSKSAKEMVLMAPRIYEGYYVAHMYVMPIFLMVFICILLLVTCAIPAVIIRKSSLADLTSGRGA